MKKAYKILLVFSFVFLISCMEQYVEKIKVYSPIYLSYEEFREPIVHSQPKDLENTGKIYFKGHLIFINQELKGVHVINNIDSGNPQNIAFIEIPGNIDIAVKDNILYADSYIDLVAIDISNPENFEEVSRVEKVFPYMVPPPDDFYAAEEIDKEKGVVVGWEKIKLKNVIDIEKPRPINYPTYPTGNLNTGMTSADFTTNISKTSSFRLSSGFGIGGSMARFGLFDNYLYVIDETYLYIFNVSDPSTPLFKNKKSLSLMVWDNTVVETMFLYDSHMFLGTQNDMRVYSLQDPLSPSYKTRYSHIKSCDPVVVSGEYAYITLRDGTICNNNINRLDVLKLSDDYMEIDLVHTFPMNQPYGLGIDGDILFICDGDEGLKVYDAAIKYRIDENQLAVFPGINAFDVIPVEGRLFMIGKDGFYQYNYADIQNITQISYIPVKK